MNATTLNCHSCGAAVSSDSPNCSHCGARLATIACPACFKMMFLEARFCPACGSPGVRWETAASEQRCPGCRAALLRGVLGDIPLHECSKCFGLWLETQTFERICQNAEKQAAILGRAHAMASTGLQPVRYLPCVDCGQLMHRMNFAKCSGVIVDVCRPHGIWFDKNELHRIVQFIHSGGLERSRAREKSELAEERRRSRDISDIAGGIPAARSSEPGPDLLREIVSAAGDLFVDWL